MTKSNKKVEIPFEIWEVLTYIGLPKSEMSCLMLILKKTLGWGKKRDEIAVSQFIKATKLPKSSIFRALNKLKKKRIIFSLKNDNRINVTYGINTRIQNWETVSKMRLDIKNETDHQSTNENNSKNKKKLVLKKKREGVSKMRLHNNTYINSNMTRDTGVSLSSASVEAPEHMSDLIKNKKTDLIPKKENVKLTKKNARIFAYYYQEHFKKQPALNTKTAKRAKICLDNLARGTLFDKDSSLKKYHGRKFSEKEIKLAIDRHITKAVDDTYQPRNKGYLFVYLPEFFYNKFSRIKSLFLESLENPPVPVVPILADRNPELSKALFEVYNKEARNGISVRSFDELVFTDKNCFTVGAFKLSKFFKLNNNKINKTMVNTNDKKAKLLWAAIMMCANNDLKKISPFWFKADFVFERLPIYMKDRGYLIAEIKKNLI